MGTPSFLGVMIVLVTGLLTIGVLVALPLSACLWRDGGGYCNRRRDRLTH